MIKDEFTKLKGTVSRQRIWQMRKVRDGKCRICGKTAMKATPVISSARESKTLSYCEFHKRASIELSKNLPEDIKKKNIERVKLWRKANRIKCAEYATLYREKIKNNEHDK